MGPWAPYTTGIECTVQHPPTFEINGRPSKMEPKWNHVIQDSRETRIPNKQTKTTHDSAKS